MSLTTVSLTTVTANPAENLSHEDGVELRAGVGTVLNAVAVFCEECSAMVGDRMHVGGRSGISANGQAGKGNAGAWQSDARSGAWVDLQSTAGEQSAALYQLLDEVFAGLFE